MANRTYTYLNSFFKWASRSAQGLIDRSPMEEIEKPWDNESIRTRKDGSKLVYNDQELASIWVTCTYERTEE
jgi:hypothetical protein